MLMKYKSLERTKWSKIPILIEQTFKALRVAKHTGSEYPKLRRNYNPGSLFV